MIKLAKILFWGLFLASCGANSDKVPAHSSNHNQIKKKYFVQGDPLQIIKGSTLNKQSFITSKNVSTFQNFTLNSINIFSDKEDSSETLNDDIHEGNEHKDFEEEIKKNQYSFYRSSDDNRKLIYATRGEAGYKLNLHFVFANGVFNLASYEFNGETFNVEVLHYSLRKDMKAFGILFLQYIDGEKDLVNLTFSDDESKIMIPTNKSKYNFSAGNQFNVRWRDDLNISICTQNPAEQNVINKIAIDAAKLWESGVSDINIDINLKNIYPPFSDLNVHCIYTIDSYLTIENSDHVNFATTLSKYNYKTQSFIDSDIFIWKKEFEKLGGVLAFKRDFEEINKRQSIIIHEIGHMLGLAHIFDGTKSIMSYENQDCNSNDIHYSESLESYICGYDLTAIKDLYSK